MTKVILVTGASTGIGRKIAARLAGAGYQVYGTSRKPQQPELDGFTLIPLDVTSDASVAAAVAAVLERAGRIDVLINNAGVELLGALEEISVDEAKTLFETNFFGVMRTTAAVLPIMRTQRSGLLINISSLAGLGGSPCHGIYTASKYALEGYTETLWYEVEPFGIQVALVEPGFFKSEIGQRKVLAAKSIPDYNAMKQVVIAAWDRFIEQGEDPQPVADSVLAIVQGRSRSLRHFVGRDTVAVRLKLIVPDWMVKLRIRRRFGLRG